MKRLLSLLLVFVLSFSMVACSTEPENNNETPQATETETPQTEASAPVEPITLQIAMSASETSPGAVTAIKAKELIEAKYGGSIKVDDYPNAQLGGDREWIELTQ